MTQEDDGEVKLLGICSYTENAVKCWKPDGSSAKNLEPTVDNVMRSDSGNRGRMRYGYKNRVLVFSRPARVNVSYRNPEGGDNGGMFETQSPNDAFGPKLEIVFASTSMGNSVGTIVARVQGYEFRGKTGEIPMKPGAQVTVDGIPVKIGAIKKMAANDTYANFGYPPTPNRLRWKAEFASDRKANPEASVNYELLGMDGAPIQFVDEKGHPKARAANPMMGYNSNGMMNAYQIVGNSSGGTDLVLMVDPAFVKRVRVTVMRAQLSMFKDIPLDPKR